MTRKILAEFDAVDGPFIRKLSSLDASVRRFEVGTLNSFGRVEKGMASLVSSASRLSTIGSVFAGGLAANFGVQFLDQATRIRNALKGAGDDSDAMFKKVYLASTRSLASFEAFSGGVQAFQKALASRQGLDASIRQMETLNKLLAAGGKSTAERQSTMTQFGQALQSGVLQGDELKSLRENAPIELMRALAAEAGGTIETLKDLGSEGKITTDVMVRALVRLESEADRLMSGVRVSISDATTQMRNGAIVAAEGFDKGLGLSRVAVTAMQGLGAVLGDNAEAAQRFGEAAQVAIALFASVYAGGKLEGARRGVMGISDGWRAQAVAIKAAAVAAESDYAAAVRGTAQAKARFQATTALVDKLSMQAGSEAKLARANEQHSKAVAGLALAQQRQAVAANVATAATDRLALANRIAAGAMNAFKGAMAFLGGVPGILLIAATAFYQFGSSAESAADKMARLTDVSGTASAAADSLRNMQSLLKDAITETGDASSEAARKIVAASESEYNAKKKVLELDQQKLAQTQAERVQETVRLVDGQNADRASQGKLVSYYEGLPDQEKIAQAAGIQEQIDLLSGSIAASEEKIIRLRAAHEETANIIATNNGILAQSFGDLGVVIEGSANAGVVLSDAALASYNERLATLTAEANMQALIRQFGEESYQVTMARAAAERESYAAAVATDGITGELAAKLMAAYDAAQALSSQDVGSMIRAALGPAAELAARLWDAASAAASARMAQLDAGASVRTIPGGVDAIASGQVRVSGKSWRRYVAPKSFGGGGCGGGSGGGGGGGSAGKSPEEEALRFIEQMMTAEEKRAVQIKEMTDLRAKLVATVGEEHSSVTRLDEAIGRAKGNMDGLNDSSKKLKDDFLDAVEAGNGFGGMLDGLAKSAKRAFAEMLLFNSGPWANTSKKSGGLLGNVFSGLSGLLGFADGGVMTSGGSMPLKKYAAGGVAKSPQLALFGEGSMNEAYVPLPDGRSIPVTMKMPDYAKLSSSAQKISDGGVRYIEVPYVARVDADDGGRLVGRIERVRNDAYANDVSMARQQAAGLPSMIQTAQDRGTMY